jgi:hypothetical protein
VSHLLGKLALSKKQKALCFCERRKLNWAESQSKRDLGPFQHAVAIEERQHRRLK